MLKELLIDIITFPIVFISNFPYLFLISCILIQGAALPQEDGIYIHLLGLILGGLLSLFGVPDLTELD